MVSLQRGGLPLNIWAAREPVRHLATVRKAQVNNLFRGLGQMQHRQLHETCLVLQVSGTAPAPVGSRPPRAAQLNGQLHLDFVGIVVKLDDPGP